MGYEPDTLETEARRQRRQVEAMTASLDDAAFSRAPRPHAWSVGECLEHLTLINATYMDALDEAVARGRAAGHTRERSTRAKRHGWLGDRFVRSLEPPVKLKGKAFKSTIPRRLPRAEVLRDFMATQDRLIGAIEASRDLDYARVRMSSPFFKPLRLSLGQSFGAMLAHNRRHILQAEMALERKV